MSNKVNITLSESDYHQLLVNGSFMDMKTYVKVLPDDTDILEDANYIQLKKAYKRAREAMEQYRFNKLTNGK